MNYILIKNVSIITMENEKIFLNRNVLLKGEEIASINYQGDHKDYVVIDGTGKYLMPGLHDMHVHLRDKSELQLILANGVTSVRDMMGRYEFLEWKSLVKSGDLVGPNLYLCSLIFEGEGDSAMVSLAPEAFFITGSPDISRQQVRKYKDDGFDFIKIYDLLTNEVYDAILDEASKLGMPVVGHVPYEVGYEKACESGQKSIEHIQGNEHEFIELLAKSDAWICPTITAMEKFEFVWHEDCNEYLENDVKTKYITKKLLDVWKFACNLKAVLDEQTLKIWEQRAEHFKMSLIRPIVKELFDKGAKIVAGTDQGIQFVYPGIGLLDELENYTKCGIPNFDALKTATINAAELLGNSGVSGTVTEGKNADLVLLNSNPLEDINAIRNIEAVFKSGTYYSREALDELLQSVIEQCNATKVEQTITTDVNNHYVIYAGQYKKMVFKMDIMPSVEGITAKMMGNSMEYIPTDEAHKFISVNDSDAYIKFSFENNSVVSLDSKFMGKLTTMKKTK